MIYGLIFLMALFFMSIFFIFAATIGDVKDFRNKKTVEKVATNITHRMSNKKIKGIFLKQNIWEMKLFWCGILIGIIIGGLLIYEVWNRI